MRLLSSLVFAAAMAAGATETTKPPAKPMPTLKVTEKTPDSLKLYTPDGSVVAECPKRGDDMKFSGCKIEPGFDLNDVMNAWVNAYLENQK